jgi:vancomycin resistance protein YoaR
MRIPRPSRITIVVVATALAVTLPGLGLAAAYAYTGDLPRGTTVLGIDLGAQSHEEAVESLSAGLAERSAALAAPIPVRVGDQTVDVDPAQVGLAVDVEATVSAAEAGSSNPFRGLFAAFLGPREVEPVVTVDAAALHEQLRGPAKRAGEAMTMPAVKFEGTEPVAVYPEPGLGLDPQLSARTLAERWPALASPVTTWRNPKVVEIPLVEINPVTTAEEVDRLIEELAMPAVAAPVTIAVEGGGSVQLTPAMIAKSLRLKADERGEITPKVNPKALRKHARAALAELETRPVDAEFVLTGNGPEIEAGSEGELVNAKALARDLLPVLSQPDPRTVTADLTRAKPDVSRKDLEKLGVRERISSFTTEFTGGLSSPRSHNIVLTAQEVDGALLWPGKTFSLNGYTGPRGYEQGYQDAPVILDGKLVPAVGGGISQFTTTLFNASYYAGLEDVEHHPHSYYYSRYPAVIESTIFYDTLDMRFRNNTEYGVLIDTSYTESSITVTMWGTKVWDDVTTEYGERRDPTDPPTRYLKPGPDCIDTTGIPGFTQDAWRVFWRDGSEVKREQFTWRYDPQPEFICGEKPDGADEAEG